MGTRWVCDGYCMIVRWRINLLDCILSDLEAWMRKGRAEDVSQAPPTLSERVDALEGGLLDVMMGGTG